MPKQKRDSHGRFERSWMSSARENPGTSAAVAAGVAGLAAAGAFLWTRRDQVNETLRTGRDRLSEFTAQRLRNRRSQEQIAEEALTLKETGKKSRGVRYQRDIADGLATVS